MRRKSGHYSLKKMMQPTSAYQTTNTGYKYISERNGKFRVRIRINGIVMADKWNHSLEDALAIRNWILKRYGVELV